MRVTNIQKTTLLEQLAHKNHKNLKEQLFSSISFYMEGREAIHENFFYIGHIFQTFSFFWFCIMPTLNIFDSNVYLYRQLSMILKAINFYEQQSGIGGYQIMTWIVLGYLMLITVIMILTPKLVDQKGQSKMVTILRPVVNFCLIWNIHLFTLPFLGLAINILYCSGSSPYDSWQCYGSEHILYCIAAVLILVLTSCFPLVGGLLYYSRSPFEKGYFGHPNRNYFLSKFVIKIIYVLFFILNSKIQAQFFFILGAPALWGIYIFYHRLNGQHSANHCHFYKEFFLEGFIFSASVITCCLYYLSDRPNTAKMILINLIFLSLVGAYTLIGLEKHLHRIFLKDCLTENIKKQDMDRFIRGLINELIHAPPKQAKIALGSYKYFNSLHQDDSEYIKKSQSVIKRRQQSDHTYFKMKSNTNAKILEIGDDKGEVYEFILESLNKMLKNTNDINLKIIKAQVMSLLGYSYISFHSLLELQNSKLSFSEQYAIYNTLKYCRQTIENSLKQKECSRVQELTTIYRYQEESNQLQELMNECAVNNRDYWEELGETVPSLSKLRDLAMKYVEYIAAIISSYAGIQKIMPESCVPTIKYLHFLLHVGIDVEQTIKIRQQLKLKFQKRSLQQVQYSSFLDEENMSMIVVDSVGSKLGHVVNCNKQIQLLLGYEKQNLVNKNVTRIMPKFYSDLHNSFILNFLKGQSHTHNISDFTDTSSFDGNSTAEKIVSPINSEGFLMEVNLRLHPVAQCQSSLYIVALMKGREANEEAIVMVDSNGVLLAIDANFEAMLKHKIKAKQIINEEIKLNSLFPELNMRKLQQDGPQHSCLEIEHLCEENDVQQIRQEDTIEIRRIKIHGGKKVLFLSIRNKIKRSKLTIMPQRSRNFQSMKSLAELSLGLKDSTKDIIKNDQNSLLLEGSKKQLTDSLLLMKKLQQFVQKFEAKKMLAFLDFMYASACLFACCFSFYIVYSYQNTLNQAQEKYRVMQKLVDVPYQISQINLFTNNIWSINSRDYQATDYSSYFSRLNASILKLSQQNSIIARSAINIDYPFEYNQDIRRDYRIYKDVNGTVSYDYMSMNYPNALETYLASARTFIDSNQMDEMYAVNKAMIQQEAYFITANGDNLLPSVALSAAFAYQDYFHENIGKEVRIIIMAKVVFSMMSFMLILGTIVIGLLFIKKQKNILKFYSKMRLWDISELASKCQQFLWEKGKAKKRQRGSSIINILPTTSFIGLTNKNMNIDVPKQKKQLTSMKYTLKQEEEQMLNNDPENQKSSTDLSGRKVKIQIELVKNYHAAVKIIILITLVGNVLWGISIYNNFTITEKLSRQVDFLVDLSVVRKTLTYMDFFAYQMVAPHPDVSYSTKIATQAEIFYRYSTKTFQQIGNQVLSDVYSVTQNLQQYFTKPSEYSVEFLRDMYSSRISRVLQTACQKIIELDQNIFQSKFANTIGSEILTQIILSVLCNLLYLVLSIIFIMVILKQNGATICMLKIIPAWVVERSSEAREQIFK